MEVVPKLGIPHGVSEVLADDESPWSHSCSAAQEIQQTASTAYNPRLEYYFCSTLKPRPADKQVHTKDIGSPIRIITSLEEGSDNVGSENLGSGHEPDHDEQRVRHR